MRGFARPGDYNTRILLLLDGHRLNDGIYDMAPIGTGLPDRHLADRADRGHPRPGVVALRHERVLRRHQRDHAHGRQPQGTPGGNAGRVARDARGHRELWPPVRQRPRVSRRRIHEPLARSGEPALPGVRRRTCREAEWRSTSTDDESSNVFGSLSSGRFSIRGGVVHRRKQIPTASYGTVFGDDSRIDRRRARVSQRRLRRRRRSRMVRPRRGWPTTTTAIEATTRTTTAKTASALVRGRRRRPHDDG